MLPHTRRDVGIAHHTGARLRIHARSRALAALLLGLSQRQCLLLGCAGSRHALLSCRLCHTANTQPTHTPRP
jgi:hypothetical protein